MEQADQLLKSGDLAGARAALVQAVRERPGDADARMFLFQLLAVAGEWDKADTQVRALAQTTPEAQMLATVYGQAIAAEKARSLAFAGQAPVPLLLDGAGWLRDLAAALEAFAKGDAVQGALLRDQAFDAAPEVKGAWNGEAFEMIADADSRFGPALEVMVGGRWGLIGLDEIAVLKSEGPKDLRDIVWLPVEMTFRSGRSAAGFLPARYPGTEASADQQLRLARATAWQDGISGQQGIGQRVLFAGDSAEYGLLSLRQASLG